MGMDGLLHAAQRLHDQRKAARHPDHDRSNGRTASGNLPGHRKANILPHRRSFGGIRALAATTVELCSLTLPPNPQSQVPGAFQATEPLDDDPPSTRSRASALRATSAPIQIAVDRRRRRRRVCQKTRWPETRQRPERPAADPITGRITRVYIHTPVANIVISSAIVAATEIPQAEAELRPAGIQRHVGNVRDDVEHPVAHDEREDHGERTGLRLAAGACPSKQAAPQHQHQQRMGIGIADELQRRRGSDARERCAPARCRRRPARARESPRAARPRKGPRATRAAPIAWPRTPRAKCPMNIGDWVTGDLTT